MFAAVVLISLREFKGDAPRFALIDQRGRTMNEKGFAS